MKVGRSFQRYPGKPCTQVFACVQGRTRKWEAHCGTHARPEVQAGHLRHPDRHQLPSHRPARTLPREEEPYLEQAFQKRLATYPEDVQIAVRTPEERRTPGQKLLAAGMLSTRNGGEARRAPPLVLDPADGQVRAKLQEQLRELRSQLPK